MQTTTVAEIANPEIGTKLARHVASRPVQLLVNFFRMSFNTPIMQYSVKVEAKETLTGEQFQEVLRTHVLKDKEVMSTLNGNIGKNFILMTNFIYATTLFSEPIEIILKENLLAEKVLIQYEKTLDPRHSGEELSNLFGRLVRNMIKKLGLTRIGQKMFNANRATQRDAFELWPGFASVFVSKPNLFLLNVDICTKVVRQESVLNALSTIRNRFRENWEQAIAEQLVGKSVMTRYNKRFYIIKAIELGKTPRDTFLSSDNTQISFAEYAEKRYNVPRVDLSQPMILSEDKKTRNQVYLIPELCQMTGLTDQERANRQLMTSLDGEMKPEAAPRLQRSMALLDFMQEAPKSKEVIDSWKIGLDKNPMAVTGQQLDIGALLFANNDRVEPERTQNLDREMQKRFFSCPPVNLLIVFYASECRREFDEFMNNMQRVLNQLALAVKDVKTVEIQNYNNFNSIKGALDANLSPAVTAHIMIIPGPKKKGKYYDEIKRYVLRNRPVPNQIVLASTMGGKNLQSIVTKIFVQLCAKIGGVPWAINDLPFAFEYPTMIVGLNHHKKSGVAFGLYTMMATMDATATIYWPEFAEGSAAFTFVNFIEKNLPLAIEAFQKRTTVLPQYMVVYEEGVSRGEQGRILEQEIEVFKRVLREKAVTAGRACRLIFVASAKTQTVKMFYNENNQLNNPRPGTYVSEPVSKNESEFFLISQRPTRGLLSPISYTILHNEITEIDKVPFRVVREAIAKLTNKLCYLYYNTSNPIKVPAPIHLALRLAYFVTEHSTPKDKIFANDYFKVLKSAYFI